MSSSRTPSISSASLPPLCPLSTLPPAAAGLRTQKVLLLVTAVNSFAQRVLAYLQYLEFTDVSVQIASTDEAMEVACRKWNPDLVICPFLTRRIPDSVFNHWITLVVHPGPPGDAGPSSLDWVLLGDTGSIDDSNQALTHLLSTSSETWSARQRSHWGTIVFQANEHLDGGSVWAWEQYELPSIGQTTKAGLYQNQHSIAAVYALITAMIRVYTTIAPLPRGQWMTARPDPEWEKNSVSHGVPFLGGVTHERPLLQSKMRKPDWSIHTAVDVARIIYASDSQPGAQLSALSSASKTSLFAYGAHLHQRVDDVPTTLYTSLGYGYWSEIPDGRIIATRNGAVFIKTKDGSGAVGVWITHGRVPKKAGSPLEPKIPMTEAIVAAGHGVVLQGVQEWEQGSFDEKRGTWQEVFVRTLVDHGKLAKCVYWNFYNGAFSTRQCQTLLKALQWATAPERGNVKILALMGGSYFSNGIALNTIEASSDPATETWANINAIDDIVEFLVSDTHTERSPFMADTKPLSERGIVTIACLRGNAAAGGVALAAACDITIASRGVVLNPAYRAMGLHGSEFHSFSYLARCGPTVAASMLRDMLPQSSAQSYATGLVDVEIGTATSTRSDIESLCLYEVRSILTNPTTAKARCAPWCKPLSNASDLVTALCVAKRANYASRTTPLLHYRNEELSQMLLDSYHPVRSKRYHERRYKFIRKVRSDATPARYAKHLAEADPEDLASFDDAPGWQRGQEWAWAGLPTPASLATSEWTRINLYPGSSPAVAPVAPIEPVEAVDVAVPATADPVPEAEARKESTASAMTISYSSDTHASISSADSIPYPSTPPVEFGTAGKSKGSTFFRRKPSEDDSPTKSKFKTFSKRFSLAWRKSDVFASFSSVDLGDKSKTVRVPPNTPKVRPNLFERVSSRSVYDRRSSTVGPSSGPGNGNVNGLPPSPKSRSPVVTNTYVRPNVPGGEKVEFACLYDPENAETATRRKVVPTA